MKGKPIASNRKRKSEKLTKQEHRAFINWVKKQHTKIDAAEAIGIHRVSLDRIYVLGSGNPKTISTIRSVI